MLDAVENFLAVAATHQPCAQFQLIVHDAKRRLAVGKTRRFLRNGPRCLRKLRSALDTPYPP